jgi:NAD(P)-dependent dehydrogenase (short-subunit alcohol dehydrogenase family)
MQMHCLHRRLRNSNISVTSAHPGIVETNIGAEFKDMAAFQIFLKLNRLVGNKTLHSKCQSKNNAWSVRYCVGIVI